MALHRLERLAATANQAGGSVRLSFELHPCFQTQCRGRCVFCLLLFLPLCVASFAGCWAPCFLQLPLLCRAVLRCAVHSHLASPAPSLAPDQLNVVRSFSLRSSGPVLVSTPPRPLTLWVRAASYEHQHPALALAPKAAIALSYFAPVVLVLYAY